MSVDGFTFAAQVMNFLVLVALLHKFLYGPITNAMKAREQSIADRIQSAVERERAAEELQRELQMQHQRIAEERRRMLEAAKAEAEQLKQQLMQEVRCEIDEMRHRWRQALRQEQRTFVEGLQEQIARQMIRVVRTVLSDLSDSRLEERIVATFSRKLEQMQQSEKARLKEYLEGNGRALVVQTSFDCPHGLQSRLTQQMHAELVDGLPVEFQTNSELIAGIELKAGGYKVAWSIDGYLEGLQDALQSAIDTELKAWND